MCCDVLVAWTDHRQILKTIDTIAVNQDTFHDVPCVFTCQEKAVVSPSVKRGAV